MKMKENYYIGKLRKLLHLRFSICTITTFEDYCNRSAQDRFFLLETSKIVKVYPLQYFNEDYRPPQCVKCPTHYFARLSHAFIIGNSSVVKTSARRKVLYDIACNLRYRITDPAFLWIDKCHQDRVRPMIIMKRLFLRYFEYGKSFKDAISLVGNNSSNYYHYIFEIISKFYLLEKIGISEEVPIIIDDCVRRIPQFKEILDIFNQKRTVVYLKPLEKCLVSDLFCLSYVHQLPPNFMNINDVRIDDIVFDVDAISYVREMFLQYCQNEKQFLKKDYPKKLFVIRGNNQKRRYNEKELLAMAKKYGYVVFNPEKVSFREQATMFGGADYIIGASGAAFSNIICCKEGCKVLILMAQKNELTAFSTIAGFLGVKMRYLCGVSSDSNTLHTDFVIDIKLFKRYLDIENLN